MKTLLPKFNTRHFRCDRIMLWSLFSLYLTCGVGDLSFLQTGWSAQRHYWIIDNQRRIRYRSDPGPEEPCIVICKLVLVTTRDKKWNKTKKKHFCHHWKKIRRRNLCSQVARWKWYAILCIDFSICHNKNLDVKINNSWRMHRQNRAGSFLDRNSILCRVMHYYCEFFGVFFTRMVHQYFFMLVIAFF